VELAHGGAGAQPWTSCGRGGKRVRLRVTPHRWGMRGEGRSTGIAIVDFFFYDTLVVISPLVLVVLGCASFGLLAGVVMLICFLLRRGR
jgi:hypothetical protein